MDGPQLQLVQLRLPGRLVPLHYLRLLGGSPLDGFPGSEPLCTDDAHLVAAYSGQALLRFSEQQGSMIAPLRPARLAIEVKRCRRALARPPARWSGTVRGSLAAVDDLVFDAAASLGDAEAAHHIGDESRFHGLYAYVWGQVEQPPAAPQRTWWWDAQLRWLDENTRVIDPRRGVPSHHG